MSDRAARTKSEASAGIGALLQGGGLMGGLMRAHDWAATPVGPPARWPQSLRTAVSICLNSRFPILIWWGAELVMLYNDAYSPLIGTKHPGALGQPGRKVFPEIWDIIGPMLEGVLARGEATWSADQLLVLERHGYPEECYFTFSYSPIREESGEVGGVFTAVTETTQQILSERRLRMLQNLAERSAATTAEEACQLAAAVLREDAADLPFALIYLLDDAGDVARLVGTAGLELGALARPHVSLLDGATDDSCVWPLARVARTGRAERVEDLAARFPSLPGGPWPDPPRTALVLPVARPGQERPYGFLVAGVSPRRALDGDYCGFLDLVAGHIATAIANARAYEEERRRAEALAALDRAKTAFFSNVSHEFRTPLTLILAPLEAILKGPGDDISLAHREALDTVYRNGLRLLRLVNTLLDFSRIEAGRAQATYEPVDLPALTADLASAFRSAMERAGLTLRVETPPLPAGVEVYVDHELWEKIVLNLLSNAFKHTFEGEIAVSLRATDDARSVELVVQDTGTGIPPEEMPHLFERFHRVRGARARTHEGTGIGLALVHELVKLHGGTIAVESELGVGSTFTVSIPTGCAHLPPDRVGATRSGSVAATSAVPFVEEALRWLPDTGAPADMPDGLFGQEFEPLLAPSTAFGHAAARPIARILLADDNADMRAYLTRLLRACYDVEAVADGAEALEVALARPPDLVLADVMMPRLDGFELLRALREEPRTREIPVVLLSARAGEEATVEGLAAGADDYLVKPFSARELLARVGAHVELARVRKEASERERAALAEAEDERARLYDLFMQAPAIIGLLRGPEHIFELANPRLLQFLGRERDFLGKPVREGFPDLADQGYFDLLDDVYRSGEPFVASEMPVRLDYNGDGVPEESFVNLVYVPFRDAGGQVAGILFHAVEVTEQVLARRKAEEALQVRDQFIGMATHELRTPLALVKGNAQMALRALGRGALNEARAERHLRGIVDAADRLDVLMSDLLEVSRMRREGLSIRAQRMDLAAVARGVASRYAAGPGAGHRLVVEIPARPVIICGDAGRLEQVLDNMLNNALKYSPDGGEIRLTLLESGGGVALSVRDRGIGLPPGQAERIFEPFGRASNARARNLPGIGLGLYICRQIVEAHGGRMWAESDGEGHGATVHVWLPTEAVPDGRVP